MDTVVYDPIKQAQECLARAIAEVETNVVDVNLSLEELRFQAELHHQRQAKLRQYNEQNVLLAQGGGAASEGAVDIDPADDPPTQSDPPPPTRVEHRAAPPPPAPLRELAELPPPMLIGPPQPALSPTSEAGRKVLLHTAVNHVKRADEDARDLDVLTRARLYHSAMVHLELLRSFGRLPPELEQTRQYTRWQTYRHSHLVENMKTENLDGTHSPEDHYILHSEKELGKGTYGRVLVATHRGTGRQYACKVVNVTRMEPRQVSKVFAEVSVMRELDHPHIVRLREVFYSKRHIFMVMDLMTGGELFDLVTARPGDCATEGQIIKVMADMIGAVGYMHRHGIIHRDLKLENFLLESPGELQGIKLIDFGLAKHFAKEEFMHQAVGSTYYVAPEVLLGSYGSKCDMWSMGVITYMMLSGAPPFFGANDAQVRSKIMRGQYDMPEPLFKKVSPEGRDFVRRLLVLNPEHRFSATQALHHPWLRRFGRTTVPLPPSGPLMKKEDLLQAMRDFREFSPLRRLVLQGAAFRLPLSDLSMLRDTFETLDFDSCGTVSTNKMMRALQGFVGLEELEELCRAATVNRTGELDYNEFIAAAMWTRIQLDEEGLHEAFESLDFDGTGCLTAESLQQVMGLDCDAEEVERMIAEADLDSTGRLDYIKFARTFKFTATEKHQKPVTALLKKVRRTFGAVRAAVNSKSSGSKGARQGPSERVPPEAPSQTGGSSGLPSFSAGLAASRMAGLSISDHSSVASDRPGHTDAPASMTARSDASAGGYAWARRSNSNHGQEPD